MKINKDSILEFFKLSGLAGEIKNTELLLDMKKTSISCQATSSLKTLLAKGSMKGKFDDIGKLGIDDLPLIKNYITSLTDEEVDLSKQENTITVKQGRSRLKAILRKPEYILNVPPDGVFDKVKKELANNETKLTEITVKDIITKFKTINPSFLRLKGTKKSLDLILENQGNEMVVSYDTDKEIEPFDIKLGKLFVDLLEVIGGEVFISAKNSTNLYLRVEREKLKFEYIVARIKE